jgi:RHS repeat-associated protein
LKSSNIETINLNANTWANGLYELPTIQDHTIFYVKFSIVNPSTFVVYLDNWKIEEKGKVILQENHYYPYGKEISSLGRKGSPNHEFTYNGKELSEEFNWDTYDYGARGLYADFPVWKQVDPLAEKMRRWSPYAYAFSNPVRFIDPDGMAPMDKMGDFYRTDGTYVGTDHVKDGKVYVQTSYKDEEGDDRLGYKYIGQKENFLKFQNKANGSPHKITSKETNRELVGLSIYINSVEGGDKYHQFIITGGDRDKETNKKVGGTSNSAHVVGGSAADIITSGMSNEKLAIYAANSNLFSNVIHYNDRGDYSGFGTHLEEKIYVRPSGNITPNSSPTQDIIVTQRVINYQRLPPHVHVDNSGKGNSNRLRYTGNTTNNQSNPTYSNWKSNTEIK